MLLFNRSLRLSFCSFVLVCLLTGVFRVPEQVYAAPPMQIGTADLSLTMTVNNATPNKTDAVIFTITVINLSLTDVATGVTVQVVLPAGVTYLSDNSGGAYSNASGNWVIGSIASSGNVTLNITTNITSTGAKTNSAQILASTPVDPDPANNFASVTVTPKSADLVLQMDPPTNLSPNKADPVIFTIRVSNAGPDTATGVTVKDLLPVGLTYVSDSGAGTYNKDTGIWTVGTVGVGGSVTLNIITNVTTFDAKTNSAEVWTSNQLDNDSTPGNGITTPAEDDYVTSLQVIPKVSDLKISMPVPPTPPQNSTPNIGDIVVFRVEIINETLATVPGASNATGVRVNDLLPAGLTFISYNSSSGTYTSSTGNWSVGSLSLGATKWLEITASVANTNAKTNVVEVTESDQLDFDSTPANGITTEDDYKSVTLTPPSADIAVSMTVNNATPNKADDVIFTLTVRNLGTTVPATGVTVKDLLPAGLSYQSHSGGTYNKDTGVWLVGSLPVLASDTLTITARATTTGAKNNTASVLTSNQFDPDVTNNSASVTVTPRTADLSIVKAIDKNAPNPGDTVKFTITLSNAGPDAATNVTVKDILPNGYSSPSYAGGTFDPVNNLWLVGTLSSGTNAVLTITATVTANADKTNKAEVWASAQLDPDSTPQNNSISEDDDDAAPKVDLSITKTVNGAVSSLGSNIVFTLKVDNAGPASATGVFVRDILPSGLSYLSNNGGATYNSTNRTILWQVGTLGVGVSRTLTITMNSTTIGAYTNYAEIWSSDQYDIDSVPGDGSTTSDDDDQVSVSVSYPVMSILINEVAWAGTAASVNDEWIELYNPGTKPINLTGWTLKAVDGTPAISLLDGYILQPGAYFLLERTDDTTVSDIIADQIYTGELANSSETLQLLDPLNRVIDTANSNGGIWPAGSSSTFGSMERRGAVTDGDSAWLTNTGIVSWGKDAGIPNDCTTTNPPCLTAPRILKGTPRHANWAISVPTSVVASTSTRSSTTYLPPPPPLIAINEFVPRPGHDWNGDGETNTGDEYIELINHGVIDVNLSGYRLDDEANIGSTPYNLPSVTLKPGERIVFYGAETGLLLSDGGDGVRLTKPNGQLMDAYNYTTVFRPDQAYCRLPDDGGADDWHTDCFPSPGLKNSLGSAGVVSGEVVDDNACPISDVLPFEYVLAECTPFGHNIWRSAYWDDPGWLNGQSLPAINSKWDVFAD